MPGGALRSARLTNHLLVKKLKEIATVRTGYPFRERIERVAKPGSLMLPLVQMGDVDSSVAEVSRNLQFVQAEKNWENHVLQPEDVLFISRGKRNEAATFTGGLENVIPAPHLFIIRPQEGDIHGPYLTWFLNLPRTQEIISSHRRGSTIPFVPMDAMETLDVPLPSLTRQKKIAALHALSLMEQALLKKLRNCRQLEMNALLWKAAQQATGLATLMEKIPTPNAENENDE